MGRKRATQSLANDLLQRMRVPIEPPSGCSTCVDHPILRHRAAVPVAIVFEHRFAFYHWIQCKQNLMCDSHTRSIIEDRDFRPPDLVSMDWHDDCGNSDDFIEDELLRLNQRDKNEVALFCWMGLRFLNDGHIAPAMWLNAIGNAYIIQRQHRNCKDQDTPIVDRYEKAHHVFYFRSPTDFSKRFASAGFESGIIWDVDLDYFTQSREIADQQYTPRLSKREVRSLLSPRSDWMKIILRNLKAITIALEPEYTGGLSVSLDLFKEWESVFFDSPLFSRDCRWRTTVADI